MLNALIFYVAAGGFFVILFYFLPRSTDRLRAKAPRRFTAASFRWHIGGWILEPEALSNFAWFVLGLALFGVMAWTSPRPNALQNALHKAVTGFENAINFND
ncbi:MAG TPA: hypothetical protein VH684_27435 [Xanthobacteraceae bacterium]|jgi:hypothetical protein